MKKFNQDIVSEYLKLSLPHINRKSYKLVGAETGNYIGPMSDIFEKQMVITIEESRDYDENMDSTLRYAHGFKTKSYDDWPMRDHALTIIVRKKRWRHKVTGQVHTSKESGFIVFEGTSRAEDQLGFLK